MSIDEAIHMAVYGYDNQIINEYGLKSLREISLAEVIEVMEGAERPATNAGKSTPLVGALLQFCRELGDTQRDRTGDTSLADLVEQAAQREPMWYI